PPIGHNRRRVESSPPPHQKNRQNRTPGPKRLAARGISSSHGTNPIQPPGVLGRMRCFAGDTFS
ncbi:hypothetical protein PSTG_19805, partial [Puccinia striiformis f. sp. tritici PST-78]